MALIDGFTEDELVQFNELKEQLEDAFSSDQIHYYTQEMHCLIDQVEERVNAEKVTAAVKEGRRQVIKRLLANGMSLSDIANCTSYSIHDIRKMLNISSAVTV